MGKEKGSGETEQAHFGNPAVTRRAPISCKRPYFSRSSGQGCNVGGPNQDSEDECEGNTDACRASVGERILEG